MTNKSNLLVLSFALALLSACTTTPNQAPVVDRTQPPPVKPATPSESAQVTRDERGLYTVKKGDTLIRIALEYGQNYRDLVTWNNLSNPNDIKVDQVLRVLPPESTASTGNGVQTGAIVMPPPDKTPPPPVIKKSEPKGEKKPYSDSALAELQRPDSGKSEGNGTVKPASAQGTAAAPLPGAVRRGGGRAAGGRAGRRRRRRKTELDVAVRGQGRRHLRRGQEQGASTSPARRASKSWLPAPEK